VLNNDKRSATVVAETKGLVLVISKVDLMKIAEAPAGFVETLQETMNLYSPVETRVVGSAEDSLGEKMTDTELQELYDGLIEKGGLTELV
ncbi:MAG: hypothetical protein JKX97_08010, partial [Candidatus Lindowbacteria bacterium]|nr:hypothetical protein [Candidatus Lindowbacteria bacterium]